MNATSSRAHTLVTIHFDQIIKSEHGETKKMSVINLVDLAGKKIFCSSYKIKSRIFFFFFKHYFRI